MKSLQSTDLELTAAKQQVSILTLKQSLEIGCYLHTHRSAISSSKHFGQWLRANAPALADMPSWYRSNCMWLYRASNAIEVTDLFEILEISSLTEHHSGNPSVIRRDYRKRATLRAETQH
jgi:hypothetical protein